ncbi:MAG TPA: TlpA disulfide reductase family protein [Dissulfurispiraceae bacterium]|nr:TlpA disulfide reductase family protein [Dissulfurispiraceae bacterium]
MSSCSSFLASRFPFPVFFILLISSFLFLATVVEAENPSPYAIESLSGRTAPDFTLNDLDGKPISLSSYKGKVVILTFWATWCPPCKEELQSLNKLYNMLQSRGLVVLAVSSDRSLSTAKEFMTENRLSYPVLFDEKLTVSRDTYKAFMVPTTFVIDRRGTIFRKHFGEQDWTRPALIREIETLL